MPFQQIKSFFFFLILAIGIVLWESVLPKECFALIYYWGKQPQSERIIFQFDGKIPEFQLKRTAKKQLTLFLPPKIWEKELKPTPVDLSFSHLVDKIVISRNGLEIKTKHEKFGFISARVSDEQKIVLDIFYDPLGAKWSPPQKTTKKQPKGHGTKKTKPKKNNVSSKISKKATETKKDRAAKSPELRQTPARGQTGSKQDTVKQKIQKSTAPSKQQQANATVTPVSKPAKKEPLYKIRAPLKKVPPDHPQILRSSSTQNNIGITQEKPEASQNAGLSSKKQSKNNNTPPYQDTPSKPSKNQPLQDKPSKQSKSTEPSATAATAKATSSHKTAEPGQNSNLPDFEGAFITAKAAMANGELDAALEAITPVARDPRVPENLKEEVLYFYADLLFQKNRNNLEENFSRIVDAFEQAINYDPESPRLATALLNLGYVHLQVGNIPEARAYFNLLRKKFPYDPNVPLTYFYWAQYYYQKKDFQKAADAFEHIIQKYPEHRVAQKAAVGLAKSLKNLEFYKQAKEIIDYIEQRWPRYYIDDPDFLILSGYVAYKNKKYEQAKDKFWLYVNLLPKGDKADIALARIGDIYLLGGKKRAAKEVYEETAKKFPDLEGGLIAAMRLAEEGIYDQPTINQMFSVFDRPFNLRPQKIYTLISDKFPDSPLAPVALLKLAIWELWRNKYSDALQTIDKFFRRYKNKNELKPRAEELVVQTFTAMTKHYAAEENYLPIIKTWKKYPFLHQYMKKFDPQIKLALAYGFGKTGEIDRALKLGKFVLNKKNVDQNNYAALGLMLNIYTGLKNWKKIIELGEKGLKWNLPPKQKRQLRYATALAYEKLGHPEKALPLWRKLAADIDLPKKQRAYALYFLAQDALVQGDLENVYVFAQEALSIFLETKDDLQKIKSCLGLLIKVTEKTGRKKEALGWALELATYIKESESDWPAFEYQLARLYKINGDTASWKKILTKLINKKPDSLFSKMAKSDLNSIPLLKEASKYFTQ
jgi:tetratricopeptide (TPR) repeat protein